MNKEIEVPVKIKIKSHKDGFNVTIKTKVIGSEAVPLANKFIEELKAAGYETSEIPAVETKEVEKETEPAIPICPTHNKELVQRKGQYGMFWACPTKLENGNWCKFRPKSEK
jgi:hypothetical protein